MLFAEGGWGSVIPLIIGAVCTGLGLLLGKILPYLVQSRESRDRSELTKREKEEAWTREVYDRVHREFQELLDRQESDVKGRDAQLAKQDSKIDEMFTQVRELTRAHADCLVGNERLTARIAVMEAALERYKIAENASQWATMNDAVIVIDDNAVVREWSPTATALFHWRGDEAIGREICFLMPDVWKDRFWDSMGRLLESNRSVRRGPHKLSARNKEGDVFPVEVTLASWRQGERRFFTASVRRPLTMPDGSSPSDLSGLNLGRSLKLPTGVVAATVASGGAVVSVPPGGTAEVTTENLNVEVKAPERPPDDDKVNL
jgi:PAS domain S-box-containing protein